ncbi:unnamed protein product [Prunus armeniaca]|uniref:Secreted protein n=1 Tax=Prunus armeniaca TaxID=36596 RepID=A0A6J5TPC1_PRUAR|nr:unnamed protein product [Prunus armeniaca]
MISLFARASLLCLAVVPAKVSRAPLSSHQLTWALLAVSVTLPSERVLLDRRRHFDFLPLPPY